MKSSGLSPKQWKAIALQATGITLTRVREEVGISEKTLQDWNKEEEYQRELQATVNAAYRQALDRAKGLSNKAIDTLESLMDSGNPQSRLSASKVILETAHKANDADILARLEVLEQRLTDEQV